MIVSHLFDCGAATVPFLAAICVGSLLYYYYYYCSTTSACGKWRRSNVPHVPRPKPLFGNTFRMVLSMENQADAFDRVYRRFPRARYCGFHQMSTPFLMVRDPELIAAILVKDFAHFTDHGVAFDESVNLLARSLFFATGRKWRTMRQKLSPAFSSGKLRAAYDQIRECGERMTRGIADRSQSGTADSRAAIEVKETVGAFATDVIGTCAFGLSVDAIACDGSEFRRHTRKLSDADGFLRVFKIFVAMLFPGLARLLKLEIFPADATEFFRSVFKDVVDYRAANSVVRNDVAQTLIRAREDLVLNGPDGDEYTDLDIIANAVVMFSAGAEPVSITTALCLYELAVNEDIQNKLRAEVISARRKHEGKITSDFLSELQFADMVLNETFRKYSIAIAIMREATQDYHVPGGESLLIEKGQKIVLPMYSVHHDPKYYPDPSTFDPERFSAEEKSKRPAGTFFPFSVGPRQCIAKRFAEMEIKLVLSEILSKFELFPCEKTDIPLKMKIGPGLLTPKNGVWLSFKPISK